MFALSDLVPHCFERFIAFGRLGGMLHFCIFLLYFTRETTFASPVCFSLHCIPSVKVSNLKGNICVIILGNISLFRSEINNFIRVSSPEIVSIFLEH